MTVDPDGAAGPLPVINRTLTLSYGGALPPEPTTPSYAAILEAAIRAADPNNPLYSGATVNAGRRALPRLTGPDRCRLQSGSYGQASPITVPTPPPPICSSPPARAPSSVHSRSELERGAASGDFPELDIVGVRANKTGLFALEDVDIFNILCVPAAAELRSRRPCKSSTAAAEAYCLERRAFLIVDIPDDD